MRLDWDTPGLACQIRPSGKGSGALIGAGMGVLVGGIIGLASGDDSPGWWSYTAGQKVGIFASTFGIVGAVVGAITGQGSIWQPLDASSGARRVSLLVDGSRLGVSVRF